MFVKLPIFQLVTNTEQKPVKDHFGYQLNLFDYIVTLVKF